VKNILKSLTELVERVPRWVIVIISILSLAAIPGTLMLKTDSGLNTLVSPDSAVFKDTQRYQAKLGYDPVTIILNGPLQDIFSAGNLAQLNRFEQEFPVTHDCDIASPVTILNQAIKQALLTQQNLQAQIALAQKEAAQTAKQQAVAAGLGSVEQEQAEQQAQNQVLQKFQSAIDQFSQMGNPSLDNPDFIAAVLYQSDGAIKQSFTSLIPDQEHVLLLVTPAGNLNADQSLQLSHDIENYFSANKLQNVSATVVGYSLVTEAISDSMKSNLLILLGLAVLVMLVVLAVLFRVRWRLLSLLMVGIGVLWTFGLMGYIPIPITMATMAVLPVLIGLGIDYPIQFHNRYQEELARSKSVTQAVTISFVKMMPAVGIALLATVVGFATLYISSVPMIRDFGIILVAGVVFCYLVALFLLYSIVFLADKKVGVAKLGKTSGTAGSRIEKMLAKITGAAVKYPLAIFLIALALGAGGIAVDHWIPSNTDFQKLIPQNLTALNNIRGLNSLLGMGGQINFMVEAEDVTSQTVLKQLKEFEEKEIALHAELISANSPATFISKAAAGSIPAQLQIDQILENTPAPLVKLLISDDRKMASLSFGTQYIPLDQVHNLLTTMQADSQKLDGIRISPQGTTALSAATIDSVINSRFMMDGLCLGAIFIILLLIYRRLVRSLFIIFSIGMVVGWSSLIMFIFRIPLNPLTAILGVITTAIGTEFMVLLTSRYEEEKSRGEPPRQAMLTAVSKMGRAIVTTGITTLGGFGVLIASNFVLIRDFGIVTVIGIFLCLISTIIVMPPLMVWWDTRKKPIGVLSQR
jgi:hydrophobe/amphiphile efflux-3 (HAE3) family protein